MSKKSMSQKRHEKELQENKTLQKVLNAFLLGLVAECYLFMVYRGFAMGTVSSLLFWHPILRWSTILGLVAFLGCAVAAVVMRKNTKLLKILSAVSGVGFFFALSGWMSTNFFQGGKGVIAMCVLVPVVTILCLVYFLFQRECFLSTLALSGSILTVWLLGAGIQSRLGLVVKICSILAALILAAVLVFSTKIKKANGKLGSFDLFSADCKYTILYAALIIGIVGILAAFFFPVASYYLLWALGIAAFGELVYFTTQLM